jgi:starch synthase
LANTAKLKICLATSEFAPLAKTGGLADVSAALSRYLYDDGHDVRALMPWYSTLKQDGLAIEVVDGLQNLVIDVGPWNVECSIVRARFPNSNGFAIYLLYCPALYERDGLYTNGDDEHLRFILLSRAALEMCQRMGFAPDIMHCHDWHTAMIPLYLRSLYAWDRLFERTRSVLTLHNIGYQGIFSTDIFPDLNLGNYQQQLHQDDFANGRINFLKTGLLYANLLTTVSPTYAREIQGSEYGMGLDDVLRARADVLLGILNGVDDEWNPETDPLIPKNFSARDLNGKAICKRELLKEVGLVGRDTPPLIGIVSRLVGQKGFDLVERVVPGLLAQRDFSLVILGSGEARFERFFEGLQRHKMDRVLFYKGYNDKLAHWIEAGSDMFLMPSRYEPCGLNQMYSLKYGTVPIVRETGGLADSVQQVSPADKRGTGILFRDYDESGLAWAMNRALDLFKDKVLWKKVMRNGMAQDFTWHKQGAHYVNAFLRLSRP